MAEPQQHRLRGRRRTWHFLGIGLDDVISQTRTKASDTNGHGRVEVDVRVAVLVRGDLVVEVQVGVDLGDVTVLNLVDGNFVGSRGHARHRPPQASFDGTNTRTTGGHTRRGRGGNGNHGGEVLGMHPGGGRGRGTGQRRGEPRRARTQMQACARGDACDGVGSAAAAWGCGKGGGAASQPRAGAAVAVRVQ